MNLSRRGFLAGLAATIAAPAIVKAEILMPVKKVIVPKILLHVDFSGNAPFYYFDEYNLFKESMMGLVEAQIKYSGFMQRLLGRDNG